MKAEKEVGLFVHLFSLLSTGGTSAIPEPVKQIPGTQSPRPSTVLTPSSNPTSTLDPSNQQAKDQLGGFRFCQVWPEVARLGPSINVSVFGMPANAPVTIYVFPQQKQNHTRMADQNGYVNADILIPMTASLNPHTDGYWEPFHQGIVLDHLHHETGQTNEVLPLGTGVWNHYSFSISPNDRRLAYLVTDPSPVTLNIRDIQTGDEQSFELDPQYDPGGGCVWSPDSQKLVFSITQFDINKAEYMARSIIVWDREKSATTPLIKDQKERLVPVEWIDGSSLRLQIQNQDDTKFEFNLSSGERKQIEP